MSLAGKVCLVTGASRGIGKGIALQLGEAGAIVYVTGRSSSAETTLIGCSLQQTVTEITSRGGTGIAVVCDHSDDLQVKNLFSKIKEDHGKLDILVNNAFSPGLSLSTELTSKRTCWETEQEPGEWWDLVNRVGLRNNYICSVYASRMMAEVKQGLIVNISSFGAQKYALNVAYGVGKAAVDKMSADMAVELRKYNVSCISLYPGAVNTELMKYLLEKSSDSLSEHTQKFVAGETPEFSGKAVVALALDPSVMAKSGKVSLTAELAKEYNFTENDGSQPSPFNG